MALNEILSLHNKLLFPAPETGWPLLLSLLGTALDYRGTRDKIDPTTFSMIKERLSEKE